jgi:hypothetical protein
MNKPVGDIAVTSKRLIEWLSGPRAKKLWTLFGYIWTTALVIAFAAGFFENRYPGLKPYVWWTLLITFGGPLAVGGFALIGMMVIWPGVEIAKAFLEGSITPSTPKLVRRLTIVWCCGAGVLLSIVLGTGIALIVSGVVTDIKVWFLGVCWVVLMVPWVLIGLVGHWLIRRSSYGASPAPSFTSKGDPHSGTDQGTERLLDIRR